MTKPVEVFDLYIKYDGDVRITECVRIEYPLSEVRFNVQLSKKSGIWGEQPNCELIITPSYSRSEEWKYKEVPYAEESYYKLFLNGKEISGYKILIYQTSESIYPERAIVADGEAMFVTKHMLDHDDEIPTYEYKAGDKFEIESVGNSRMRFYAVYDIEGNKLEYDGKDRFYPIENIDTLGAGTYYLGFSVVEERNEHLFKGSEYYDGIYYIKTESYLYIKITIE